MEAEKTERKMIKKILFFILLTLLSLTAFSLAQQKCEWKKISSMNCTRQSHAVERIGDEKIIAIGGEGISQTGVAAFSSAELLDSVTGVWRFTQPMKVARDCYHKTVKLDDGKILVVGGLVSVGYWTLSCEIFDPITEKWSFADSLILNHRQFYSLTKLSDGRVLLVGGIKDVNAVDKVVSWNQCEIYNPVTNTWKLTDSLSIGRFWHSTVLLRDGRVLVAGGAIYGGFLKACEVFDPVTEKWSSFPDMNDIHYDFTLFTKEDGTIVASGYGVEIFENGALNWSKKTNLFFSRRGYTPVIRSNRNVLYCGGNGSVKPVTYEEYDLSKYSTVFVGNFADTIYDAKYVPINGDRIVQTGGNKINDYMGDLYIYNTSSCYVYTPESVPVELTTFTGSFVNGKLMLSWSTATETNNRGFEIERKTRSGSYQKIGFITGAGTTTIPQKYKFTDDKINSGTYTYRLKQIDFDGKYECSNEVEINTSASQSYALEQNYPNPFNPSTVINYELKTAGFVTLKVYDILGREVAALVNGYQNAGTHKVNFNASSLSSGVYIYRIQAGENFSESKKMILMR